jgi:membrane protein
MMLKRRMMSLGLAAGIAFLLLVSLVISAMLSALGAFIGSRIPPVRQALWHGLDLFLSWSFITALFAMIYKVLPEVTIRWKDVWMGAAVTSVLFTLGKFLVGFYIGKSALVSAYGAMGSLVVILIWVYYSAAILYLGAEFTKIYADQHASRMPAGPGGKPS